MYLSLFFVLLGCDDVNLYLLVDRERKKKETKFSNRKGLGHGRYWLHLFACIEREQDKRFALGKLVVLFMCPLFLMHLI